MTEAVLALSMLRLIVILTIPRILLQTVDTVRIFIGCNVEINIEINNAIRIILYLDAKGNVFAQLRVASQDSQVGLETKSVLGSWVPQVSDCGVSKAISLI